MFIDTHCHPLLQKKKDRAKILENFQRSGWKYLISIWVDLRSSQNSIKLSQDYDFIFSTIGIHPCDVWKEPGTLEEKITKLENLYLQNKGKVVGIWECGLDYYRISKDNREKEEVLQKKYFIAQIELAKKHKLPLVIHNREAGEDILQIIKETNCKNFIIHCFSEDLHFAKKCIEWDPNCMMSFWGILTFNNSASIQETAKSIPLENIIIETDAPYLTPVPLRGKEENEPAFTKYVLEKIIELRTESPNIIETTLLKNSEKIFWL